MRELPLVRQLSLVRLALVVLLVRVVWLDLMVRLVWLVQVARWLPSCS
jgi:hypothetical protein